MLFTCGKNVLVDRGWLVRKVAIMCAVLLGGTEECGSADCWNTELSAPYCVIEPFFRHKIGLMVNTWHNLFLRRCIGGIGAFYYATSSLFAIVRLMRRTSHIQASTHTYG